MSIPRNLSNFADNITSSGTLNVAGINATGTPSSSTVLAGNGSWSTATVGTDYKYYDSSVTASSAVFTSTATQYLISVPLTSTTELLIFYGNTSCHAVVWDDTSKTFGTPQLIRTATFGSTFDVNAVEVSSTSVLVCSLPNVTTALQSVVLTISGTSISIGTPVSTTLAVASTLIASDNQRTLIQVGSSYIVGYFGTQSSFRAITVSGTVPTIGSELTYAAGTSSTRMLLIPYNSTTFVHVSASTTLLYAVPISVSGTTLTQGTQATTSSVNTLTYINGGLFTSGRIGVAYYLSTTTINGAVISVTGTTASISVITLISGTTETVLSTQFVGNQAFVSNTSSASVNVLTGSTSSAFAGTAWVSAITGSSAIVAYNGTNLLFRLSNESYVLLSISGNNPVLSNNTAATSLASYTTWGSYSPIFPNIENSNTLRTSTNKVGSTVSSASTLGVYSYDGGNFVKPQQYQATSGVLGRSSLNLYSIWSWSSSLNAGTTLIFRRIELT